MHRYRLPLWLARQPRILPPIVVFQSDDWGYGCATSLDALQSALPDAVREGTSAWFRDAKETSSDLVAIRDVLRSFQDCEGRAPVFTLSCIVGVPSFRAIAEARFERYISEPADLAVVASAMSQQEGHRVFEPCLHGAEHLAPGKWLALLRSGEPTLRRLFDLQLMPPPAVMSGFRGMGAAYLLSDDDGDSVDAPDVRVACAISTFRSAFGTLPRGFVAPNHAWGPELEAVLSEQGVSHVQAAHYHYSSARAFERGEYRTHAMGSLARSGLQFQTRTVDFEPLVKPHTVASAVARARLLLARGVPVVVNTHRVNYVGAIDPEGAKRSLATLAGFIRAMLESSPQLRFLGSTELDEVLRGRAAEFERKCLAPWLQLPIDLLHATARRGAGA